MIRKDSAMVLKQRAQCMLFFGLLLGYLVISHVISRSSPLAYINGMWVSYESLACAVMHSPYCHLTVKNIKFYDWKEEAFRSALPKNKTNKKTLKTTTRT